MSCGQSFRNGGWDANVYSSSVEYFAEGPGTKPEIARLREQSERMRAKIQEQEGELELERKCVCRRDGRVAELEAECAKLRKQVHRRNFRLAEQEAEIGELQDEVQDGARCAAQDGELKQARRELVQLRRAAKTRGKSIRTFLASQDANLAEFRFHNASLHRVLDQDPESSDSSSEDDGTAETDNKDDGTVEAGDRDESKEAKGSWTETEAEQAARIRALDG
ncbi:hypothetical protein B484DRAFT_409516 [Ochromonadaceae sp. CCMP2298]|nr:hypothetical protein B484DRAFT_409516 [Ochromonadaceae sp. CCMP2298]